MDNRGQVGVWLFIAFLLLIIGVVLLFIFLHGREPVHPVVLNVSNVTYYNLSIVLFNISGSLPISYVLSNISFVVHGGFDGERCLNVSSFFSQGFVSNGSDEMGCPLVAKWIRGAVLVRGLFFPDKLEFYKGGVIANSTVLLEGFSDAYYFNSTVCNVSFEMFPCHLSLIKKAVDYTVNLSTDLLTINVSDGVLQKPMLCFAFNYAISNVLIDLPMTPIPSDLHWREDFCVNVSHDLSDVAYFPLSIHYNEFFNASMNLSVLVRDYEASGMKNVGDRIVELDNR